jgi:hypothetical protein
MRPEGTLFDWPVGPLAHTFSSGQAPAPMPFVRHRAGAHASRSLPSRMPERGLALTRPAPVSRQTIGYLS